MRVVRRRTHTPDGVGDDVVNARAAPAQRAGRAHFDQAACEHALDRLVLGLNLHWEERRPAGEREGKTRAMRHAETLTDRRGTCTYSSHASTVFCGNCACAWCVGGEGCDSGEARAGRGLGRMVHARMARESAYRLSPSSA